MRFHTSETQKKPEINLIPFIDVLLVVIIFLLLSTTYTRMSTLQLNLPAANGAVADDAPKIQISITADGIFAVNDIIIQDPSVTSLSHHLIKIAESNTDTIIVINADGYTPHQSVVMVMDAAKQAGLPRLSITTRDPDPQ